MRHSKHFPVLVGCFRFHEEDLDTSRMVQFWHSDLRSPLLSSYKSSFIPLDGSISASPSCEYSSSLLGNSTFSFDMAMMID